MYAASQVVVHVTFRGAEKAMGGDKDSPQRTQRFREVLGLFWFARPPVVGVDEDGHNDAEEGDDQHERQHDEGPHAADYSKV